MKTILLGIFALLAISATAQTNKIVTVSLPTTLVYRFEPDVNYAANDTNIHFLKLVTYWTKPTSATDSIYKGHENWELQIENYPFVRTDWSFYLYSTDPTIVIKKPLRPIQGSCILISAITNYTPLGHISDGRYIYRWITNSPAEKK